MEDPALPNLATCLAATAWRWLLLIAESHGLRCSTRLSKAELVAIIHQHLTQPAVLTAIITQQSPSVQRVLAILLRAQGAALAQPFKATYGEIQPLPAWRRGLAQSYLAASITQRLVGLGLLYADPPQAQPGVVQRMVVPAELRLLLQPLALAAEVAPTTPVPWVRPGHWPDLAWHMAIWLATVAVAPAPLWRGGWLPPTTLAQLNVRIGLGYTLVELRSERRAPYLAFLHYLAEATGLVTTTEKLTLTPVAWQWLAADTATRWQQLWQGWSNAGPELTERFQYDPIFARAQLYAQLGHLPLDHFTPLSHFSEKLALNNLYARWGDTSDTAATIITTLCTGPLFWLGVLDVAGQGGAGDREIGRQGAGETGAGETGAGEIGRMGDWPTEEEAQTDAPSSDARFRTPHSALRICLTPQGAWLLALPAWAAPNFPKPGLCKRPAREPDLILAPPTSQPLHLVRLAPLCQWTPPASPALDQQLRLDPAAIGQAVANGLHPAQLFQSLTEASGAPPNQRQSQRLRRWIEAGQAVRVRPLLVLETTDAALMNQLRSRKLVRRHLDTRLSPTRSVVHPDGLAALGQTLRTLEIYTQLPATPTPATLPEAAPPAPSLGADQAVATPVAPDAGLLWLLIQIYQGLSVHVTLPLPLPDNLLDGLRRQLTFAQQTTAESLAQRVHEQLDATLRGYFRLPTWRLVEPQGDVLACIEAALAADPQPDLRIAYWAADDDHKLLRRITPYGLETHAKTLYLTAYCHLREETRVFRVDRIESCERVSG